MSTTLASLLGADPNFANFSLIANQALQGESLLISGFPATLTQALSTLLPNTSSTINTLLRLLFVQNINVVSGNFVSHLASPNSLSALNTLINALGIPVQISLKLGSGPPAVINAGGNGTIPVAMLFQ